MLAGAMAQCQDCDWIRGTWEGKLHTHGYSKSGASFAMRETDLICSEVGVACHASALWLLLFVCGFAQVDVLPQPFHSLSPVRRREWSGCVDGEHLMMHLHRCDRSSPWVVCDVRVREIFLWCVCVCVCVRM
jgi:hypothetical protein